KANVATLLHQNSAAANGDIGITTSLFPNENCPAPQKACAAAPKGEGVQLSDKFLKKITLYTEVLAVPARRHATDPDVMAGERLFTEIGCAACHTPTFMTGKKAALPLLENQKIHPFTDLLLHDMGSDLADNRPDFEATGTEWRTPPLWGIGLVESVNKHTRFLHDGRARNMEEAILWHGGEGEASKEKYRSLDKKERHQLLAFLNSL
ncbi:MAG: c-type cytochrome, partial [Alphaproteobacteria bacterium]